MDERKLSILRRSIISVQHLQAKIFGNKTLSINIDCGRYGFMVWLHSYVANTMQCWHFHFGEWSSKEEIKRNIERIRQIYEAHI